MEPSDFIMNYFYKILEWDIQKYLIPEKRLSSAEIDKKIEQHSKNLHDRASRCMGYQLSSQFSHTKGLETFLDIHINNIGDPFQKGTYLLNTKEIEYAVVRYYATLWNARMRNIEIDADPHTTKIQQDDVYWGYVLSMGSSQGNIMATWMGRDYVGGKYLIIDKEKSRVVPKHFKRVSKHAHKHHAEQHVEQLKPTVLFASTAAHYSVLKAAVLMNVPSFSDYGNEHYADAIIPGVKDTKEAQFPDLVPVYSDLDGRVNPDKLIKLVEFFAEKKHAIMIVLNYGTTFTGAFDEIEICVSRLREVFTKHDLNEIAREVYNPVTKEKIIDTRAGYWIHIDGAYGAAYLPYLVRNFKGKEDQVVDTTTDLKGNKTEHKASDIPQIDMSKYPEISSVVTSGHKFPGAPWPCGIYVTRHKYQLHPPSSPMYIGSMDSTLSGSRNGMSALVFWKYLSLNSDEEIMSATLRCLKAAQDFEARLRKIIVRKNTEKGLDLRLVRCPYGLTLIFSKLRQAIRSKYTLAEQTNDNYSYNHMFMLKNIADQPELINNFLKDVDEEYSFERELVNLDIKEIPALHHAHSEMEKKKNKKHQYNLGHGVC